MLTKQCLRTAVLAALLMVDAPSCKRANQSATQVASVDALDPAASDDSFETEAMVLAAQVEIIQGRDGSRTDGSRIEGSFGLADGTENPVDCSPPKPLTYRQKIACTPPPSPDDPHVAEIGRIMGQTPPSNGGSGRILKQVERPGVGGAAIAAAKVLASPVFDAKDLYVDGKNCLQVKIDCKRVLKDSALLVFDSVMTASMVSGAGEMLTVARAAGKFVLRYGKQRVIAMMQRLGRREIAEFLQRAGHDFYGGLVRHLKNPPKFGVVAPMEGVVDACPGDCVNRTLAFFRNENYITLTNRLGTHFQPKTSSEIVHLIQSSRLGSGAATLQNFVGRTPDTFAHLLERGEGFYVTLMVDARDSGHAVATIVRRGREGLEIITHDAQLGRSYYGLPAAERYQFYPVNPSFSQARPASY